MSKYVLRTRQRKAYLQNYLGGKCKKCGTTDNLEFDHIDHRSVSFRISQKLTCSIEYLMSELKKCQLLCNKCHWEKTRIDRGLNKLECGTVNKYINGKCRCQNCKTAWTKYFTPKLKAYR